MRTFIVLASVVCLAAPLAASAEDAPGSHGVALTNLDRAVKPCDDFYAFATGGWTKANPIPPAYSRWGTFSELAVRNQDDLKSILEAAAAAKDAPKGSIEQRLGDFYAAAMDVAKIDKSGAAPLAPELERIAAVDNIKDLARETARLHRMGVGAFFGLGATQDAKDATKVIAVLRQRGLGMPDRDYYLKDDPKSEAIRTAYVKHVANVFRLLGDTPEAADAEATTVMRIETGLAKISMSRVDRRDPDKTYNPTLVSGLMSLSPAFPWRTYLSSLGEDSLVSLNVAQPDFFKGLSVAIGDTPIADWRTYLRWQLADDASPFLSDAFVNEAFAFRQVLSGAKEDLPRWRKAVAATNRALGEDLGQLYVKTYFSAASKAKVLEILHNIRAVLKEDLETLPWMTPETRAQAVAKLAAIEEKIGYPEKWRDYSKLEITRDSYYGNMVRASEFEFARDLAKIGRPVDRTEWFMTPPTVNAYYNPSMNEIVFPAGILQPPFFDPSADDAINYGAIGAVMGHEITHGFDDQGAKYDAEGNLKNWWAEQDLANFKARGEKIVAQASGYEVGDLHLNGKLVEGEAIADIGGVTLAWKAYQRSLEGKEPPIIDGFTGPQRFFIGFATVWAGDIRPEEARTRVLTDPHPPAAYRVDETLANIPAFAQAFSCQAGPMALAQEQRADIW